MPRKDKDNPEWTKENFSRARPPHEVLPADVMAAFPKTRGPQKAPKKVPVSIRLSPEVVAHYKALGSGWQKRIDEDLRKAAKISAE
ncbi:MAG: BrnA antitoxin family protein [Parvibaculaceae bacterium]|nr:BrnA antitoxin family protein [Parvibaculaceae bacterium]